MQLSSINKAIEQSCKRIAPAWPLKNFIAVNPYTGYTDNTFGETARAFKERGNIRLTMPLNFYLEQIEENIIAQQDIEFALQKRNQGVTSIEKFTKRIKQLLSQKETSISSNYCFVDIVSNVTGHNWTQFMVDKVSFWASSYYDEFVTQWNSKDTSLDIYRSWKREAEIDLSPEIMGLKNFRSTIKSLPDNYLDLTEQFLGELNLDEAEAEAYLHSLFLKTLGWSSYISGIDFNNGIYTRKSDELMRFLAILLGWEFYFYKIYGTGEVRESWYQQFNSCTTETQELNDQLETELILQDAYDHANQRNLIEKFKKHRELTKDIPPKAQLVFCIDVRSEIFRRNLEYVDPTIETLGFAGFFGFPINYVPLGHTEGYNQCPALIPTQVTVKEKIVNQNKALKKRISRHQIGKTWKKFKSGAITSFGFVSPLGLTFLPKLLLNAFNYTRPVEDPKTDGLKGYLSKGGNIDITSISLDQRVSMAASAITSMGLKNNFANIILITGHESTSVNNPHASGLECGACGGHSGEKNALTAQLVLNDIEVREALVKEGIFIPKETLFVACVHNTTTDIISIINEELIPDVYKESIESIKQSLNKAGERSRQERLQRLNMKAGNVKNIKVQFIERTKDWSQIRPEWGLAGCNSFVIAPRSRTVGLDLQGKAFLHSYDWKSDSEFGILEGIMTAPLVVTTWINLQYYASTVDNQHFGAGNKTLHNITGGLGVLEGSSGDLRVGLPLQSVHNGEKYEHLPQRLNVVIEAPKEAINHILSGNEKIRQLFDNSWVALFQLNEFGVISYRYMGNYEWQSIEKSTEPIKKQTLETV